MRYLHFCPDFLVMQKNGLIRKLSLISKFMTSQSGQQINAMHVLPNISRSKGHQTMKFGQLIEYNRIFLLENHTHNVVQKLVPDYFLKNQNWAYLCLYCMSKSRSTKLYWNLSFWPLAITLLKNFKKKWSWTSVPTSFSAWSRKLLFSLYFISRPNLIAWLPLLFEMFCVIVIICCQVWDVTDFEINQSFLIKPFFCIIEKLGKKL